MKALRIVFIGTPDFATTILAKLLAESFEVVGVITVADKAAGRGRKLRESAVKKYAVANGLKVLQPTNLKNKTFLDNLKSLNANLQIVVAFRMLPKAVWQMPKYGTFNLHASLLPNYRGAAPINWAIINGETETAVTTFFIDDKIDMGEIILQEKTWISKEDTAGSLHNRLMHLGASLVVKTVILIKNDKVQLTKQEESSELKLAHKIYKENCKIDWEQSIENIYNHIRGLSPYPTAWTSLTNGEKTVFLKIYKATMERENHKLKNGLLQFDKKSIRIAVKGGFITLLEIQLAGKRKMYTREMLNGIQLKNSAYVS